MSRAIALVVFALALTGFLAPGVSQTLQGSPGAVEGLATLLGSDVTLDAGPPCPGAGTPSTYACLEWKEQLGWAPWGLGISDLSADGEREILVGNQPGYLRVFNGSSHAMLENVTVGPWLTGILVADLDEDGRQEVVVGSSLDGDNGRVHILEWTGTHLVPEWESGNLGSWIGDLEIADLDLDGLLDVAVLAEYRGVYSIEYDRAANTYHTKGPGSALSGVRSLEVANIDTDIAPEIVVAGSFGLYVLGGANGSLEWSITADSDSRFYYEEGLGVGDLNGDGELEIVVGTASSGHSAWMVIDPATKTVLADLPSQSFNADVAIADVDRDGQVEFAGTVFQDLNLSGGNVFGYLVVYDGRTLRQEWRSPNLFFPGFDLGVYRVEVGDVDHDAPMEILVSSYGGVFQFEVAPGTPMNRAPTAVLRAVTAEEGSVAALDGSSSSDPDGDALQFRWDFQADGTWDTAWSSNPLAEYAWGDDWTGTVRVEVSDGTVSSTASAPVTVMNAAPVISDLSASKLPGDAPRTIGYWGHQCTIDESNPPENQTGIPAAWIDRIAAESRVFAGIRTKADVCAIVGEGSAEDMAVMARRQLLGLWLNVASGKLHPDTAVDLRPLTNATDVSGAIAEAEHDLLTSAGRTELERAKEIADAINNGRGLMAAVVDFHAVGSDLGSDDLTFAWDFGDGGMKVATTHFNDGVGPDPFPSPEVNPIIVADVTRHAYALAGTYAVTITVTDDDGGIVNVTFVIVVGP